MKEKIILIILTITVSMGVVLTIGYNDQHENGFSRKILKLEIIQISKVVLPTNYFYYAGIGNGVVYVKDIKSNKLMRIDTSLNKVSSINIEGSLQEFNFPNSKLNITVNRDTVQFSDRKGHVSYQCLSTKNFKPIANLKMTFDQAFRFSESQLLVRQTIVRENRLARRISKISLDKALKPHTFPLEKQIDGFFCTDGLLQTDQNRREIYYMYFYRGQILRLDSNLKLLTSIKTIDTIERAKMEISEIKKRGTFITQKKPPEAVNRNFFVSDEDIYVLSALKADNEKNVVFRDNQVIDVYHIGNGKYRYSFYVPKFRGEKIREVRKIGNFLFVISGKQLLKYSAVLRGKKLPLKDH